jgi:hypothetical protein
VQSTGLSSTTRDLLLCRNKAVYFGGGEVVASGYFHLKAVLSTQVVLSLDLTNHIPARAVSCSLWRQPVGTMSAGTCRRHAQHLAGKGTSSQPVGNPSPHSPLGCIPAVAPVLASMLQLWQPVGDLQYNPQSYYGSCTALLPSCHLQSYCSEQWELGPTGRMQAQRPDHCRLPMLCARMHDCCRCLVCMCAVS